MLGKNGIVSKLAIVVIMGAVAAAPAPVPQSAQRAIKRRADVFAFAPAHATAGFRYMRWTFQASPPLMRIFFENDAKRQEIIFATAAQFAPCKNGSEHTYHVDGLAVYFTHTPVTQQAWRCVRVRGVTVRVIAATREPAAKLRPALLTAMAAAGMRIR